jgi:hypothetical protein
MGNWEKGNWLGVFITHYPLPITRNIIGVYQPDSDFLYFDYLKGATHSQFPIPNSPFPENPCSDT